MKSFCIKIVAVTLVLLGITGCTFGGGEVRAPRQLDLGAGTVTPVGGLPAHRPLLIAPVVASALLNDTMVIWRVGENGQPQGFTTYRWVAPPAQLITQRLMARLALQGAVLEQGVGGDAHLLCVDRHHQLRCAAHGHVDAWRAKQPTHNHHQKRRDR